MRFVRGVSVLVGLVIGGVSAEEPPQLDLQCYLSSDHYGERPASFDVESVQLVGPKHRPGGSVKVFEDERYQFWAMTHTEMERDGVREIVAFQVALRDAETGSFVHALSDSRTLSSREPISARISLVEYPPGSFMESGEIFFECKTPLE